MKNAFEDFDHEAFFRKAKRCLAKIPMALETGASYACMVDQKTPMWVKAAVAAALAYFVSPADMVPDFIPVAGLADDAAVLGGMIKLIADHLKTEHFDKAREWFNS